MTMTKDEFFDALYKENSAKIIRFAYRYLGNRHTADDVMQEVFLTAYTCIDVVMEHEKPVGWLYKTAWNIIRHVRDKQKRELTLEEVLDVAMPEPDIKLKDILPVNMPPEDVELLELYYTCGYKIEELSNHLGISKSACKMRLLRIRRKLEKFVEK